MLCLHQDGLSDPMISTGRAPRGSHRDKGKPTNTVSMSKQCAQLYMLPTEYISNAVDNEPEVQPLAVVSLL